MKHLQISKRDRLYILLCVIILILTSSCSQNNQSIMPIPTPIRGAIGTSPNTAVPVGTALKMDVYRGSQELTVLSSQYEPSARKLVIDIKISAIQATEIKAFDFSVAGAKGILYNVTTGGITSLNKRLLVGASDLEKLECVIGVDDSPPFLLVWNASVPNGIDYRYFDLNAK